MSIEPHDPERRLAVGYAPPAARAALAALFALDERLGGIVARTGEPTIGLMRLIWWRDALAALAIAPPPSEPLLIAAAEIVGRGIPANDLAAMVEGWEALIDDPALDEETVALHARVRGGGLFALAGAILGVDGSERLAIAGEGWARVDLARHFQNEERAAAILASARTPLAEAMKGVWPRPLRPIAQLAALAFDDARRGARHWRVPASPLRLLRILRVQTIGR
jgi:phytoene synthase